MSSGTLNPTRLQWMTTEAEIFSTNVLGGLYLLVCRAFLHYLVYFVIYQVLTYVVQTTKHSESADLTSHSQLTT